MPVKLRVAIRSDVESIMRMQRAAFAAAYRRCGDMYEGLERTAARELERAIGAPGSNCYVIVHAGRDVGVVRVARCGEVARISPIFVQPEYWRRGIGARAIGYMRAMYPDVVRWTLSTMARDEANRAFYHSLGFECEGDARPLGSDVELARYALSVHAPVRRELAAYVRREVLPCYNGFDEGHDMFHALNVISAALELAREVGEDVNLAYAAAACHDLGLRYGRSEHNLHSGKLVRADARLRELLGEAALEQVARACEDHRASGSAPRELLGRIIADADRELEPRRLIYRTLSYGWAHYPELNEAQQIQRAIDHLHDKYGQSGYMQLWLNAGPMQAYRRELLTLLEAPERIERICAEFMRDICGG